MNKEKGGEQQRGQMLLERAGEALAQTANLQMEVTATEKHNMDAEIYVTHTTSGNRYGPWYAEVKQAIHPGTEEALVATLQRGHQPCLFVTEYVNPKRGERLHKLGQQYIDTAGNANLYHDNMLVYIYGRRLQTPAAIAPTVRHFRPAELKLILLLLCDHEAINAPYRLLAERADIALGNVAETFKVLENQGFLIRPNSRTRHLMKPRDLVDRWVADYIARLRPTLVIGRYAPRKPRWWDKAKLKKDQGQWGGEVAAAHYTHYLKPGTATVYIEQNPAPLLLTHGLTKHPQGDTELLKRFWPVELNQTKGYVPPLIAYADLLAIGGPRNLETATELFEATLAHDFKDT